uniref:Putative secreted protein n=1 Tax=Amblyomma parvum TaxID=251391 RepID=A0A023G012_AMBPA
MSCLELTLRNLCFSLFLVLLFHFRQVSLQYALFCWLPRHGQGVTFNIHSFIPLCMSPSPRNKGGVVSQLSFPFFSLICMNKCGIAVSLGAYVPDLF